MSSVPAGRENSDVKWAGGLVRKGSVFMQLFIKKEKYCKNISLVCIQMKSAGIKVACGQ